MRIFHAPCSAYSDTYSAEHMLTEPYAYCTATGMNENVDVLLSCDHLFALKKILVISPNPANGYGAPVDAGLVFVSELPLEFKKLEVFNGINEEDFEKLERTNDSDYEPIAGFFGIALEDSIATWQTTLPRYYIGKYICLKFLRSSGNKRRIDIKHIQFHGIMAQKGDNVEGPK